MNFKNHKIFAAVSKSSALLLMLFYCLGCATAPAVYQPTKPEGVTGFYHRVERGQTLWRISKTYNVELDNLAEINHISDATKIEVGQLIFIPNQKEEKRIAKLNGSEDFIWPLRGRVIATFNQNHDNMLNKGINVAPQQETEVAAARSGKVVFCSQKFKGYGKTLIVSHGDGYSTVYSGFSETLVKTGDNIRQGAAIARIEPDRNAYLHFEIRKGHLPKNPLFYLP